MRIGIVLAVLGAAAVSAYLGIETRRNRLVWDHFDVVKPDILYRSGQLNPDQLPRRSGVTGSGPWSTSRGPARRSRPERAWRGAGRRLPQPADDRRRLRPGDAVPRGPQGLRRPRPPARPGPLRPGDLPDRRRGGPLPLRARRLDDRRRLGRDGAPVLQGWLAAGLHLRHGPEPARGSRCPTRPITLDRNVPVGQDGRRDDLGRGEASGWPSSQRAPSEGADRCPWNRQRRCARPSGSGPTCRTARATGPRWPARPAVLALAVVFVLIGGGEPGPRAARRAARAGLGRGARALRSGLRLLGPFALAALGGLRAGLGFFEEVGPTRSGPLAVGDRRGADRPDPRPRARLTLGAAGPACWSALAWCGSRGADGPLGGGGARPDRRARARSPRSTGSWPRGRAGSSGLWASLAFLAAGWPPLAVLALATVVLGRSGATLVAGR